MKINQLISTPVRRRGLHPSGQWRLATLICSVTLAGLPGATALAQLTPDDTLGNENSVINNGAIFGGEVTDLVEGGATRGGNLFHSFLEFNIADGQRVFFANPLGIENILSRVTGDDLSNIFGTLGVAGTADLFFLNPNGIVFGPTASLDVEGSFVSTTADAIQIGAQGAFSATVPETPALLTVNPSVLLFNHSNQSSILSQGRLFVEEGQSLILAGEEVILDGGFLAVNFGKGGRIDIASIGYLGTAKIDTINGQLGLSFPSDTPRGDVSISNTLLQNVGEGDSSITVFGNDINISASPIQSGIFQGFGTEQSQTGNIQMNASGSLQVESGSLINNLIFPNGIGNVGNIEISAQSISLSDSQISASTLGQGDAGNVNIQASGSIELENSNIFSLVLENAEGDAGDITLEMSQLSLSNGSQISASSFGQGGTGNIYIDAVNDVAIDGFPSAIFSSLFGSSDSLGGDIQIRTSNLSLTNSGKLDVSVNGQGEGGDIIINATNEVIIDGIVQGEPASAIFSTVEEFGVGSAGDVNITTGSLTVTNGGNIQSLLRGRGEAGNIFIQAEDSVLIDGRGFQDFTTIEGISGEVFVFVASAKPHPVWELEFSCQSF